MLLAIRARVGRSGGLAMTLRTNTTSPARRRWRRGLALLLAAFAGGACSRAPAPPVPDPASLRQPPAGDVVGFVSAYGSHAWRGIPYAEPPLGELRWRAPRPAHAWSGTREALAAGEICPQLASPMGGDTQAESGTPVGAEDCLTLDVFAPRFEPDAVPAGGTALPVMVWIHGGGNVVGGARFYHGGNLAARQQVVVVALNYRLGPLGWFSHPALRGEGTSASDRSGNFGTLDLVRALEWVRANVAAFGGDPGNVTIFGESAGARDVFSLLVVPAAAGLFHRAIAQSGGTETLERAEAEHLVDDAEPGERNSSGEVLLRLLVADGRAASREAARAVAASLPGAEIAAFLRARSPAELLAAYAKEDVEGLIDVPQLFRDGAVLPRQPIPERLARGAHHDVPVVFGTNRDENKVFLIFDRELARWWLGLLPRVHDPEHYEVVAEHMARWWKATAADGPATAMVAAGAPRVFVYRFDWDEEPKLFLLADLAKLVGAAHAFEIPFVFGHWDLGPMSRRLFTAENAVGREILSGQMMSYWTNFAATGAPGRGRKGDLPEWTPWPRGGDAAPRTLVLDTPADGGVRMQPGVVTEEAVIAAIGADPRLAAQRDRCAVYRRLARWGRAFDEERYARAGCAAYPIAEYPWRDAAPVAAGG
jgi:para-nitrobenzyl esterase